MTRGFVPVEIGHRFTGEHTFDLHQVRAFAAAAGDFNRLHHDADYARRSSFGRLIASGTHTTALLLGLTASHFGRSHSVVGVSFAVQLLLPVYTDATVSMEWEVMDIENRGAAAQCLSLEGFMRDAAGPTCVTAQGKIHIGPPNDVA